MSQDGSRCGNARSALAISGVAAASGALFITCFTYSGATPGARAAYTLASYLSLLGYGALFGLVCLPIAVAYMRSRHPISEVNKPDSRAPTGQNYGEAGGLHLPVLMNRIGRIATTDLVTLFGAAVGLLFLVIPPWRAVVSVDRVQTGWPLGHSPIWSPPPALDISPVAKHFAHLASVEIDFPRLGVYLGVIAIVVLVTRFMASRGNAA